MRYAPHHKEEIREKLIESSCAIAKKGGFSTTGVDALMSAIGLTGGAFYSHFGSKGELFAALIEREMAHSAHMLAGTVDASSEQISSCLRSYLSSEHALHPENGCVLPALGAEIARAGPQVRAAVERALRKLQRRWSERLEGDDDAAWAVMAQCVGALVMARAVESDSSRQEILASVRRSIERRLLP